MAAGTILTVLSNIPWGTVVENAPKVAEGATKFWNTVTRRNKSEPLQTDQIDATPKSVSPELALVIAQLKTVEERASRLNEQMQASAALIKELADQNTLLVKRVEINRLNLRRLVITASCAATTLLGMNIYVIFSR
jgi:hypothetical protein